MSLDASAPPGARVDPALPWWFGRGVGLMLVLTVGAVVWTFSWGLATSAETPTQPVAQRWAGAEADLVPVSDTSWTAPEHLSPEPAVEPSPEPDVRNEEQTAPTDHALQAQVLKERREERIRRALRSDRELAAFIESVGVLEPIELWVKPISAEYRITATFGQGGSLWSADHTGVDLAAPSGTAVASVAAGTVTDAGEAGAYGLRVEITHPDGAVTSYSHLSRIDVTAGQVVQQGSTIGAVGSTGNSTGPHLHLELRPDGGVPVNPVDALLARGVVL